MTNQTPIPFNKQQVQNWNNARALFTSAFSLISAGNPLQYHAFNLTPTDQLQLPPNCSNVHAYLVCDGTQNNLKMLLISDIDDEAIASGATNLPKNAICTVNYIATNAPAHIEGTFNERIDRWQSDKAVWLTAVIEAGTVNADEGVVQLFIIPASDFQNVLGHDAQIFLSLHADPLIESSIEVILYKPAGPDYFYDVSSPVPPYGPVPNIYGLLV